MIIFCKQWFNHFVSNSGIYLSLFCFPIIMVAGFIINPYNSDGSYKISGTHTQLFLIPCLFNFFTSLRCPGCGLTTSCSLFVHGDLCSSLIVNPGGLLLIMLSFLCFIRAIIYMFYRFEYSLKETRIFNNVFMYIFVFLNLLAFIRGIVDIYYMFKNLT